MCHASIKKKSFCKHINGSCSLRLSTENKRNFTQEQLRKAKNTIPKMQTSTKNVHDNEHVNSHCVVFHSNVSKSHWEK